MNRAGILNRIGRALFLVTAFLLLATIVRPGPLPPPRGPALAALTAVPVALDEADPARRRAGALRFLRGWALSSDDPRFGGISAMQVKDGRVIAVSDAGTLFEFRLPDGSPGRSRILPLLFPGAGKSERDSEAMLVHGGQAWVAFERRNAVGRFRIADWSAQAMTRPPAMRGWRRNSGAEAMVRLPDGRFLVFAEERADRFSAVVLFAGDPADSGTEAAALRYRRLPGFRVTDAALLPDGRLLVLNRRVGWLGGVSAKLAVAETVGLHAGATIEPREIADLRAPLTVDNMEALSVTVEGGRTIVRLASDDNFTAMQRTLLLEFALEPGS